MTSMPQHIWVVRHGQSAGNVARDAAEAAQAALIDIANRDMDSALSTLGEQQSQALAHWFAALPGHEGPTVLLCSPYVRAMQTAAILRERLQDRQLVFVADERLRERSLASSTV